MNWLIDGIYGDLYRTAMGYRELRPHDQREIERQTRTRTRPQKIWAKGHPAPQTVGTRVSAKERAVS